MRDSRNITIGLLVVTAGILAALLVLSQSPQSARATGVSVKQGDYILLTGRFGQSTDLIYVVDIAARRLNTYVLNRNSRAIEPVDATNLAKAFAVRKP